MYDKSAVVGKTDLTLEAFAAELTAAAYSVALRHGVVDDWLDLELDLWRVLNDAVRNRGGNRALSRSNV
jgi:hypothetical protein